VLSEYRRVLEFLKPYWRRLVLVVAISLLSTLLSLAQPYIAKLLIDGALIGRDFRALVVAAGLMMAVTVVGFVLGILARYRYVEVSAAVLFDMRLALFRHLETLSPRFYARTKLGDIVSRLNNDIAEVQRVSADSALSLVSSAVFLAGSIGVMLWLNARLFLLSIALVPFTVIALRHYQHRLTGQVRTLRERSADIGSFLIETLMGMRLVAASNAAGREAARFGDRNRRFVQALLRMQVTSSLAGAMPGTVLALSTAAVFLYGGKLVIDRALTVGALVAFLAYHLRLLGPVENLLGIYSSLATARVSLTRVFELLETPPDVRERADAIPLGEVRGELVFDDVSYRSDRDATVLEGVSFRVPAGGFCALIGPSGSGKSTIADLLVRFADPQSGRVTLDGADLRDLRLDELRRAVALVDQNPFLFHATIRENIAYARPAAGPAEIEEAARAAVIDDFIAGLPEGYETVVGERGLALSAGERQRIAIARALLADPAVLVLDEPTAALDPQTEAVLIDRLAQSAGARTILLITHRASAARRAGQVLVLDAARVIEAPRV